jgi:hypothetical protein
MTKARSWVRHVAHTEERSNKLRPENLKERDHLEDLSEDEIILYFSILLHSGFHR